jgi:hypothetical protein
MKPILHEVLSVKNRHPRDINIQFIEKTHKYIILTDLKSTYTSVTTWNREHFPEFEADKIIDKMMKGKRWKEGHKYWGLTPEQIKALWDSNKNSSSNAGTVLHYEIECFHNDKRFQFDYTNKELYEIYVADKIEEKSEKSVEWKYFINFIRDHMHLKPYRTEWFIYDEDVKIAGSIDIVYENPDGTLSIYDWKRSNNITRINDYNVFANAPIICHLPDSNFWHYAMQLNTYKYILESKYDKKIKDLFLVRLHPESEDNNYELIQLPDLSFEVNELIQERIKQLSAENT